MKKNIMRTALAAVVMTLGILQNAYAADNLLVNGDFAEGNASANPKTTAGWSTSSWWQWTWDNTVGYDDNTSMHFNEGSATYQFFYQTVDVEPNTDYVLSFYYKSDDPGITVTVFGDSNSTLLGEQWIRDTAQNWIKKTYNINSGSSQTMKVNLKLMGQAGGSAAANGYIDNVCLVARKPVVESVKISGHSAVGNTITAKDKIYDSCGDTVTESEYQWQISENGDDWSDISGAEKKEYKIEDGNEGMYLRVGVTPKTIGSDGKTRTGKIAYSKAVKAVNASEYVIVDLKDSFNGLFIADSEESLNESSDNDTFNGYFLKKENISAAFGESNAIEVGGIPYLIDTESSKRANGYSKDLVIELNNEYLSEISVVMAYSEAPQNIQKAVITYADDSVSEISYTPGDVFEKTEGLKTIGNSAFGMYKDGTEEDEKGYLYVYDFSVEKIAGIKSISFEGESLAVFAVTGTRVSKDVLKTQIEEEILKIPENIKPNDFKMLDDIEGSAKIYELLGGNIEEIQGFDSEKLKELRITGVLNAYNDGDKELIFDDEYGFLYKELLGFDDLDKDGVTIYSLYEELLSDNGKQAVLNALLEKDFKTVSEMNETLLREIVLKAIQYPNVGGVEYLADVLTEENTERVGIDAEKYYNASDKSAIHKKIARQEYNEIRDLEKDLVPVATKSPSKNSGGGHGGGSIIPSVSPKIDEDKNTDSKDEQKNITEPTMFKDVTQTHWAYKPIYRLMDLEIVSGKENGLFEPESYVKKEEFVKMLCVAFDVKEAAGVTVEFDDVEKNAWYEKYVNAAYSNGIVKGISENKFGIGKELTRQDLCVMAARAKGLEDDKAEQLDFSDAEMISDYAKSAVAYLVKNGVVNGFDDGSFRPEDKCTRAQAAKIIFELLEIGSDE